MAGEGVRVGVRRVGSGPAAVARHSGRRRREALSHEEQDSLRRGRRFTSKHSQEVWVHLSISVFSNVPDCCFQSSFGLFGVENICSLSCRAKIDAISVTFLGSLKTHKGAKYNSEQYVVNNFIFTFLYTYEISLLVIFPVHKIVYKPWSYLCHLYHQMI